MCPCTRISIISSNESSLVEKVSLRKDSFKVFFRKFFWENFFGSFFWESFFEWAFQVSSHYFLTREEDQMKLEFSASWIWQEISADVFDSGISEGWFFVELNTIWLGLQYFLCFQTKLVENIRNFCLNIKKKMFSYKTFFRLFEKQYEHCKYSHICLI